MSRPIIAIFGATGKQGGSVIETILADPSTKSKYQLRGVTRDVSKPAAKALTAQGVEMVAADMDDAAAVNKAIQGAYGVFAVTDYWAKMDGPLEIKQGKTMVDAAKAAGVQHFVLSTLRSPSKITNGKLSKVEHFETKAEIAAYAKSVGLPSTFYLPGFYMSNFPGASGMLRKHDENGPYVLALPIEKDARIPLHDTARDTGKYIKAIFENRDKLLGKEVYGSVKYYTPQEIVEQFTAAFPKDGAGAMFMSIPGEAFTGALQGSGMPEFVAVEMTENMFLLNKEHGYYGNDPLEESNALLSEPATTWAQFLKLEESYKSLQ